MLTREFRCEVSTAFEFTVLEHRDGYIDLSGIVEVSLRCARRDGHCMLGGLRAERVHMILIARPHTVLADGNYAGRTDKSGRPNQTLVPDARKSMSGTIACSGRVNLQVRSLTM